MTPRVEDAVSPSETFKDDATVEEAAETNPEFKEASPWLRSAPPTVNEEAAVDEAVAMNPPEASRVKSVVEAASWTTRAEPVWEAKVFKVRFVAVVEVAAIVATLRTSALVVPMPRLSVTVVSLTSVPSSVNPETLPVSASDPQNTFPEESVSSTPLPVQERMVAIWSPPVCTWSPPRMVEEAVPETSKVEDACKGAPETTSPEEADEEAVETNPARVESASAWRVE